MPWPRQPSSPMTKAVAWWLMAVITHIEAVMKKGERSEFRDSAPSGVAKRAARKARNPQTGMEMMLKAVRGAEVSGLQGALKDML